MSHKADSSFFLEKKDWSKRKDRILGSYLHAYLPAIATQKRPVLIVDAFAGPGRFGDGAGGSPLLIAKEIQNAANRPNFPPATLICIERREDLYEQLTQTMGSYPFVVCKRGRFLDHLNEIESVAKTHSTFFYADPFTVEGIQWQVISETLVRLRQVQSVEILLNFNASSFVRRALAALKRGVPNPNPVEEDPVEIDAPFSQPPTIERLTAIVGGTWWIEILDKHAEFASQVQAVAIRMQDQFRQHFREVGMHAMKALPHHTVPKYYLLFGSRSSKALILMNDEMAKSGKTLASLAEPAEGTLFETRSKELVPDIDRLPQEIEEQARQRRKRREVITDVIRKAFCEFTYAEIRGVVERMLKDGRLHSATGTARINDDTEIWSA